MRVDESSTTAAISNTGGSTNLDFKEKHSLSLITSKSNKSLFSILHEDYTAGSSKTDAGDMAGNNAKTFWREKETDCGMGTAHYGAGKKKRMQYMWRETTV